MWSFADSGSSEKHPFDERTEHHLPSITHIRMTAGLFTISHETQRREHSIIENAWVLSFLTRTMPPSLSVMEQSFLFEVS